MGCGGACIYDLSVLLQKPMPDAGAVGSNGDKRHCNNLLWLLDRQHELTLPAGVPWEGPSCEAWPAAWVREAWLQAWVPWAAWPWPLAPEAPFAPSSFPHSWALWGGTFPPKQHRVKTHHHSTMLSTACHAYVSYIHNTTVMSEPHTPDACPDACAT